MKVIRPWFNQNQEIKFKTDEDALNYTSIQYLQTSNYSYLKCFRICVIKERAKQYAKT